MQINTYYNQPASPQFTSTRECVKDSLGRVINCHYSDFNRKDMNWEKFAQMLLSRFDGRAENIKINLFGCSDASDVYTLLLHMKKVLGKDFSKLPTIKASDISAQMIQKAKNGEIVAVSEGYTTKANCLNGVASIGKNAKDAEVVEVEG